MRIGGRLQGAIEVLSDVEERRRPIANALKDWGTAHRFAGSGDRAAIGNIVYDALRLKLSHAWLMEDDSPAALAHAVLFRQWGIAPQALAERLDGDKFAPEPLSDAALKAFVSRNLADAPDDVRGDLPEWILPAFKQNFGDNWLAEAEALRAEAEGKGAGIVVETETTEYVRTGREVMSRITTSREATLPSQGETVVK